MEKTIKTKTRQATICKRGAAGMASATKGRSRVFLSKKAYNRKAEGNSKVEDDR